MNRDDLDQIVQKIKAADTDGTFTSMKLKSASVSAVIHRHATGEDENIGYVSYYHRNPLIHYPVNFMIWLRGRIRLWQQSFRTEEKK